MSDFRITEPGEYKTRDGAKAIVVGIMPSNILTDCPVFGYIKNSIYRWRTDGLWDHPKTLDVDIIGPWEEPKTLADEIADRIDSLAKHIDSGVIAGDLERLTELFRRAKIEERRE